MTVVSFDVGVRNLAVCMLDYTPIPPAEDPEEIEEMASWFNEGENDPENKKCLIESDDEGEQEGNEKKNKTEKEDKKVVPLHIDYPMKYWGVLDLMEEGSDADRAAELLLNGCCQLMKSGIRAGTRCGKPGKYLVNEIKYCTVHNPNKKDDEKSKACEIKQKKKKKVASVTTQNLCIALVKQLDSVNDILLHADEVLIELQPSVNPKMKMVSNMIYCHYIRFGVLNPASSITAVKFVSARKKLTVYDGPKVECNLKGEYAKRKKLGIEYCRYMVKNDTENSAVFEDHKKKDDLADCFLQGVWYLKGIYAKEEKQRKKDRAARKKAGVKWMSRKKYAKTLAKKTRAVTATKNKVAKKTKAKSNKGN